MRPITQHWVWLTKRVATWAARAGNGVRQLRSLDVVLVHLRGGPSRLLDPTSLAGEVLDIGLRAGSWMNLSMGCCLSELGEYVGTRFINTRIWIHFRRVVIDSDRVLWAVDLKGISIKDVSCSNKIQFHQCFRSGPHCGPHLWPQIDHFSLNKRGSSSNHLTMKALYHAVI